MTSSDDVAPKRASPCDNTHRYTYTPSSVSPVSSSASSVFSTDALSSQSSAPSSVKSGAAQWGLESTSVSPSSVAPAASADTSSTSESIDYSTIIPVACQQQQPHDTSDVVAPELRLHPRRTQNAGQMVAQGGQAGARHPPSLVRQCDRKDSFVENLVDTTTQMIEVIWPLSVVSCSRDTAISGKNVIGLRTFIQEVLKRSRTSYSTLQVALYYLVLIKPCIPKVDFTKEQFDDLHASRAMQCGRRMFLAALILASKYLQDKNYTARAWSKISGLRHEEINANELAFLKAVDWKLHIPEPLYQRWTDVVLKFSLNPSSFPSTATCDFSSKSWRAVISRLTPELYEADVAGLEKMTLGSRLEMPPSSRPRPIEPDVQTAKEIYRFPPISPSLSHLPTPHMLPLENTLRAPAVSTGGVCPKGASMNMAMKQAHNLLIAQCTLDSWPTGLPQAQSAKGFRRPSLARISCSIISSPESMVSDHSSRSSRSSSVSSMSSTSSLPPPMPSSSLAMQATRRCAGLSAFVPEKMSALPIRTSVSSSSINAWHTAVDALVPGCTAPRESYIRGAAQEPADTAAAHALRDLSRNRNPALPIPRPVLSSTSSHRKRERPQSMSDPALHAEVRALLPLGREAPEDRGETMTDADEADSFVLRHPSLLIAGRENRWSSRWSSHARSASGSRDGARKRACCEEARSTFLPVAGVI